MGESDALCCVERCGLACNFIIVAFSVDGGKKNSQTRTYRCNCIWRSTFWYITARGAYASRGCVIDILLKANNRHVYFGTSIQQEGKAISYIQPLTLRSRSPRYTLPSLSGPQSGNDPYHTVPVRQARCTTPPQHRKRGHTHRSWRKTVLSHLFPFLSRSCLPNLSF